MLLQEVNRKKGKLDKLFHRAVHDYIANVESGVRNTGEAEQPGKALLKEWGLNCAFSDE